MKENFKIGDKVLTYPKARFTPYSFTKNPRGGHGFKPNTILTIREIIYYENYNVYFFDEILGKRIYSGNFKLLNQNELIRML